MISFSEGEFKNSNFWHNKFCCFNFLSSGIFFIILIGIISIGFANCLFLRVWPVSWTWVVLVFQTLMNLSSPGILPTTSLLKSSSKSTLPFLLPFKAPASDWYFYLVRHESRSMSFHIDSNIDCFKKLWFSRGSELLWPSLPIKWSETWVIFLFTVKFIRDACCRCSSSVCLAI